MIEALSWGLSDVIQTTGYININGYKVLDTARYRRGFNFIELNVTSCSESNILCYDTFGADHIADDMAGYINGLPSNTVLIGMTVDEPTQHLTPNAKVALSAIGVNVTGLQYAGKAIFVTQINQPAGTVSQFAAPGGVNLKMTITVTGKLYHLGGQLAQFLIPWNNHGDGYSPYKKIPYNWTS